MGRIIQVRCNGTGKHINEIDVEALIGETRVFRMITWRPEPQPQPKPRIQDRYVQRCKLCAEGDVVVTREMIEQNRCEG